MWRAVLSVRFTATVGRKMKRNLSVLVAVGVAGVAAIVGGCGGSRVGSAPVTTNAAKAPAPKTFADVVASVRSGVIRIETATCNGGEVGTGILISPRLIATVEHVVDGATSITLKRGGSAVGHATVVGTDSARDVALLRSNRPITGYQFRFAQRAPRLGEDVAAIGFPLALPLTVTRGSVSGLDRTIPINGISRARLVQTDAAVNPGNSGGPLMTDSGLVVGLVDLGTSQANGLAFAVSAQIAGPLLQSWAQAPQPVSVATCNSAKGQQAAPAQPTQTSSTAASWTSFTGSYFTVNYPDTWNVQAAEQSRGSYLDTTITNPSDPSILIRVDVTPGANSSDPITESANVVAALRRESGYQELDFTRFTFEGYDALHWEFAVPEHGVLLHKEEVVFTSSNGDDFGVLVQAPDSEYSNFSAFFAQVVNSLSVS